jgi:hypothetical protein
LSGPKFDPTINLGHVLTIVALLGSVTIGYFNIRNDVALADQRISSLEKGQTAADSFQSTVLSQLSDIKVDIGVLKARDGTTR